MYIYNRCTNLLSPTCNPNPCILILNVDLQRLTLAYTQYKYMHYNTVMNIHVCVHINCVLTCLVRQGISIINSWSSLGDIVYLDTKQENGTISIWCTLLAIKLGKIYVCTCTTESQHTLCMVTIEGLPSIHSAHNREGTAYTGYFWRVTPEEFLARKETKQYMKLTKAIECALWCILSNYLYTYVFDNSAYSAKPLRQVKATQYTMIWR